MLRIQSLSGLYLMLDPGATVEIELNNWLLGDSDDLLGSFSLPINFPLSPENKRFLGHSHLPESRPDEQPVYVSLNGIMLRKSLLSYKIDKKAGSGFLKIDAGEVASKIKGKYLHEVFTEKYDFGQSLADLTLLMLAAAKAQPGDYPFAFYPIHNSEFAPKELEKRPGYFHYTFINAWDGTNFLVTKNRHVTPFLYLTYVIKKLCTYLGFTAAGSFMNDPEAQALTIYNTQALPTAPPDAQVGFVLDLGLHVPYMTIPDFLKALRNDMGLGIYFDTTVMEARFELFNDIRDNDAPAQNISPYLLQGYSNEIPDDKGYSVTSYEDDDDGFFKSKKPVIVQIRSGQKEVKASIGGLQMQRLLNIPENIQNPAPGSAFEILVPGASQPGNLYSAIYDGTDFYSTTKNHKNPFGFRLISYRGMQEGAGGKLYPFGSCVTRAYDNSKVGKWSTDPVQPDSIFNQLTIPYYNFLAFTRKLKYEFLFPVSQFKDLKLYNVFLIQGENRIVTRCLIERINAAMPSKQGLVPAKASVFVLFPSDPNPNSYTGEVFYVEMVISNEYTDLVDDHQMSYASFTFNVWADPAKTIPANPSDLIIYYEAQITNVSQAGTDMQTNYYQFTMSGFTHFLPNLVTADISTQESINNVYALTYSAAYTNL